MSQLRILFAGSGEFGLPTLSGLRAGGHEISHVYSQPDRPAGRGGRLTPTPISRFALDHGLPLSRTANINEETLASADLLVVIAFGQKIAPHVVNHPRLGAVNLHASLLLKFRGAAPINWAILRGETFTGNSVIRLAPKMDAGAVLGQSRVEIGEVETAGELHDRLAIDGGELMSKVIDALASGAAVEKPQDESLATIAPKLSRETARIDWSRPAAEVAALIRGLYPWPGCRVALLDSAGRESARLTLVRARTSPVAATGAPGTIQSTGLVSAGDHAVEIIELQPEGKRPMTLAAFRNGHEWGEGMKLASA